MNSRNPKKRRNKNFRGKELAKADFFNTDVRGSNFAQANLQNARFEDAVAGAGNGAIIGQKIISLAASLLSGVLHGYCGHLLAFYFPSIWDSKYNWPFLYTDVSLTLAYLVILCATAFSILRWGFTLTTLLTIGSLIAGFGTVIFVLRSDVTTIPTAGASAAASTMVGGGLTAIVLIVTLISVTISYVCKLSAICDALIASSAFIVSVKGAGVLGGVFSLLESILSIILGHIVTSYAFSQEISSRDKFKLLRLFGVAFGCLGGTKFQEADLAGCSFENADLKGADFSGANLSQIRWKGCKNLEYSLPADGMWSNPKVHKLLITQEGNDQIFENAELKDANLKNFHLERASLEKANLQGANLEGCYLAYANLSNANLAYANLSNADLTGANLSNADLTGADLTGANLTGALVIASQLLSSNLTSATLTGVCIQDWNINDATRLDMLVCEYVYLKRQWLPQKQKFLLTERRPSDPNSIFAPGEFVTLFQQALNTVDLIFADCIDWQAFFQSFQELRLQYEDLSIQAIEKKSGGAFVVRLEVPPEEDKAAIESRAKELYGEKLKLLEERILDYKDEVKSLRHNNTNLMEIAKTMAEKENQPTHQTIINAQTIGATHTGSGDINNFTQNINSNIDDITKLITALRDAAQTFPEAQREEALEHLGDVEEGIRQPGQIKPHRVKAALAALLAIAGMVAATTDFSNNVLEIGNKLGIELIQPHSK